MFVTINNKADKTYTLYSFLREKAPDANINTLRQISIYVANSSKNIKDVNNFGKLIYDDINNYYVYRLNDNRKIIFSNDVNNFSFKVIKFDYDNKILMSSDIDLRVIGDLTTLNVYSEIVSDNIGRYVVTFRPNDMSDDTVKFGTINYYTNDEVEWVYEISNNDNISSNFDLIAKENGIYPFADKSFFDIPLEYNGTELDCYDGCLKNYLNMVDLLFDNVKVCMNADVKKRKRKSI